MRADAAAPPQLNEHDTLRSSLVRMSASFAAAGLPTPREDAKYLLLGLCDCDATALIRDGDAQIGPCAGVLNEGVRRRLKGEPVSRILGWREFYGRRFIVTPDVLDPRPDTEAVVDLALDCLRTGAPSEGRPLIVDIGTGSGAIVVTLLAELPDALGLATDVSSAAIAVARRNAEALGVAGRLRLLEASCLDGVDETPALIVSNPPYIRSADIARLDRDVSDYDPRLALDGGPDGLSVYRAIARGAAAVGGCPHVVLEVGAGMAADVVKIFEMAGFAFVCARKDLGGHTRAVALQLRL